MAVPYKAIEYKLCFGSCLLVVENETRSSLAQFHMFPTYIRACSLLQSINANPSSVPPVGTFKKSSRSLTSEHNGLGFEMRKIYRAVICPHARLVLGFALLLSSYRWLKELNPGFIETPAIPLLPLSVSSDVYITLL